MGTDFLHINDEGIHIIDKPDGGTHTVLKIDSGVHQEGVGSGTGPTGSVTIASDGHLNFSIGASINIGTGTDIVTTDGTTFTANGDLFLNSSGQIDLIVTTFNVFANNAMILKSDQASMVYAKTTLLLEAGESITVDAGTTFELKKSATIAMKMEDIAAPHYATMSFPNQTAVSAENTAALASAPPPIVPIIEETYPVLFDTPVLIDNLNEFPLNYYFKPKTLGIYLFGLEIYFEAPAGNVVGRLMLQKQNGAVFTPIQVTALDSTGQITVSMNGLFKNSVLSDEFLFTVVNSGLDDFKFGLTKLYIVKVG